jgi:tRNA 2-selenouridine synthase
VSEAIPFHESFIDSHLVLDVRTPLEYAEDHMPGAINIPLLSNEERVEIGIIYKQTGSFAARNRGLELTAHRMPQMVADIGHAANNRPILVYCWRGGLRSKAVTSILDLAGYRAFQLKDGYKAFRNHVSSFFEPFHPPGPLVVMHGMTGIGKTSFLQSLHNFTVIDLEGLARHRGSAFGGLGLTQHTSQKHFETLLWNAFRSVCPGTPVLVEGESKRIGRLSLPGDLYEVMLNSVKVWCHASLETRIRRLITEYGHLDYRNEMAEALLRIRKRIGGEKYTEIIGYLDRWELEPFTAELIKHYYDKVYYKTREWREDFAVSLEDFAAAEVDLETFVRERFK